MQTILIVNENEKEKMKKTFFRVNANKLIVNENEKEKQSLSLLQTHDMSIGKR